MKISHFLFLTLTLFLTASCSSEPKPAERHCPVCPKPADLLISPAETPTVSVHFSPGGGCTNLIVKQIQDAKTQVKVLAYSFTSKPIIDALIAKRKAGVPVSIVLDKSDAKNPRIKDLLAAGVSAFIDRKHAIMHQKVLVTDAENVETGSFNYTFAAESNNAENCLFIQGDQKLASEYIQNYLFHQGHAQILAR